MRKIFFLMLVFGLGSAIQVRAQSPAEMSYQGFLEDGGAPVNDGNATLTFRLFDAASGGSPIWSETHNGVDVTDGVFDVTLGTVNPLNSLEFYRPLWVEVEVERGDGSSITLAPRTPLGASPYTMGLVLPILQDASVGGTALTINNTGNGDGIKGETQTSLGRGVVGRASAFTGANRGVYGISMSEAGTGVYGEANTSVDGAPNYGVFGTTHSASGVGVQGDHIDGSFGQLGTPSFGVYGEHVDGNVGYIGGSSAAARGTHSSGNWGALGLQTSGVWGKDAGSGNEGFLGTAANGVKGTNNNGNLGRLGHISYGVFGSATDGNAGRFQTVGTSNTSTVLSVAGVLDSANLVEGYLGSLKQFEFGIDGALRIFDVQGETTKIELAPNYNSSGDSRVTTQELEITGGSDLSENFDVAPALDGTTPEAGMVVAIDPDNPGRLALSNAAYDPLVAGVISGAGGVETGMIMGQRGSVADGAVPVALAGRVYVRVDASYGAVKPGDLLTTSDTPGHAMKVDDPSRAYGTVIGKAMTGLEHGRGLVLVLVSLQ